MFRQPSVYGCAFPLGCARYPGDLRLGVSGPDAPMCEFREPDLEPSPVDAAGADGRGRDGAGPPGEGRAQPPQAAPHGRGDAAVPAHCTSILPLTSTAHPRRCSARSTASRGRSTPLS
jgi:hypothetical protein